MNNLYQKLKKEVAITNVKVTAILTRNMLVRNISACCIFYRCFFFLGYIEHLCIVFLPVVLYQEVIKSSLM